MKEMFFLGFARAVIEVKLGYSRGMINRNILSRQVSIRKDASKRKTTKGECVSCNDESVTFGKKDLRRSLSFLIINKFKLIIIIITTFSSSV